jgi:amino acid adenylation domain-containing protein
MDQLSERLSRLSPEQLAELIQRVRGTGGADAVSTSISRRTDAGPHPLSFAQQRLWFVQQLDPDGAAYNMVGAVRLEGALDLAALRRALDGVVARHDALHTVLAVRDGEAEQQVVEGMRVPLEVEEPGAVSEDEVLLRATREHARGFDLAAGPLLRATLLRLSPERHVLLLAMHHLVSDGWSRGIIVREISELYTAAVTGQEPRLADLPIRYVDYAAWQRERMRGELLERELGWWKAQLAGAPEALELPADHARPPAQSFAGGTHRFRLPADAVAALRTLGREEGASLFIALIAAYETLLARYTGQADLVVGTPVANRGRGEVQGVVGFFANTLALRTELGGDPTFREALRRVRDTALGAYAHEELPFERLVEELHPRRDLSRNPVFQVMFLLDESPLRPFRLPGLELAPLEVDSGTSMFDLTLGIQTADGGFAARLDYAAELFDAATIARMAEHFGVLLRGIAADPDARLSALPLVSAEERARVAGWNATEREYPPHLFVHDLFAAQAARTPDAAALVHRGARTAYGELDARANRLANHLRALGVRPETRVGVCMERAPELIVALLAVLKAGGAYVPLDPAYPRERLRGMIEDARIPIVLTTSDAADRLPEDAARAIRIDRIRPEIDAESAEAPRTDLHPDHLSHVIFTSGSTGRPKGVMIRHRATAVLMHWMRETVADDERACMLASTSVSFDVSVAEIFGTLCWGGTLVLVENALELPSVVDAGIRSLCTVPSAAAELLRSGGIPASVRSLNLAGEALPAELARDLHALGTVAVVRNLYGPTEDTSYSTCAVVPRGAERARIGRAMANTRAHVLDAALRPAPVGVAGELYLAGDGVARGYEGRPGLTAECFLPDPQGPAGARMYRTRDRARWTAEGELEYLGRADLQLKVRGVRIEPGEIEAALRAHPAVAEAVAVVRGDAPGERRLVAYVVAAEGAEIATAAVLRAHLRERLPEAMVPSVFVSLDALPRTGSGKLDRAALPAPDAPAGDAHAAPRTPAEELLTGIYAEVLGVERIGANADFFDAGGHSLLAMRLMSRVRDAFGVELPVRAPFEAPTVAELAARIDGARRTGDGAPPLVPISRDGSLPASLAQRRLWLLHQLEPGSAAYNLAGALRIRGLLDVRALGRALAETVRRHEPLRTRFAQVDGEPVQVIDPAGDIHLPLVHLAGRTEDEREDALRALAADEALRPFDLAAGPLLRCTLARVGDGDHALLITLHHVIADGWSLGVLVREVSEVYAAIVEGRAPVLSPLPIQYADHAAWQRAWLAAGEMERQTAFWRDALSGAPPLLELPTDRPRPLVADDRGARVPFALAPETGRALRAVARREGATLFMTLLAAWQLLLSRYSGQDDVAVGTPIAGRGRTETEGLIGFFVNTLVLRTDLAGDPTFRALLGRVRDTALAAYAHQDVPFEALVEALRPERSRAHTPLFQAAFSLQPELAAPRLGEARVESIDPGAHAARFDLGLALAEDGDDVRGSLTYRTALWDRATAERMLAHLAALLDEVAADASRPLSALALMGEAERRRVLEEWNATDADFDRTRCIHHLFAEQARRTPDAQAVVHGAEALTFAELEARANRLAHHLRGLGVGPDARVGMCLERGTGMIVAILGILKAGGAYLPLDPAHPADRLLGVLEDADAHAVVTAGAAAERLAGFGGAIVRTDADAERIGHEPAEAPSVEIAPENLAYVIYTSGSTGRPKGVMVEHRSVINLLVALENGVYAHRDADAPPRVSVNGPVTFDTSVKQIIQLLRGATLCIVPEAARYDADAIGAVLRAQAVEVLDCTPAQLRRLLADGVLDRAGPALTDLLVAGEAIDAALWQELAALEGRRAWNLYGPTECTVDAALCRIEGDRPVLGGPVANARLYVLGAGGAPMPVGVPGELHVGGAGVARGYLGRPALTAERFVPDPFAGKPGARMYRTGDRVRWKCVSAEVRECGSEQHAPSDDPTNALTHSRTHALEFLGRTDFQLKIRGVRMEPGEIEAALQSHPAVRRAVVVAREDGAGERRLVGYVVAPADAAAELRAYLAARLPEYMVPAVIVALDALPLTPHGKVDRRALPAPDFAVDAGAYVAPRTPAEEILAGIFAQVLRVERVGAHDDYFALGGHSLLAARLVSRVREALGVELPLRALFDAPTPALLAARVDEARREEGAPQAPPLIPVPRDGALPLSFAQQRLWFIDQLEPGSAAYNLPYAVRLRGRLDAAALERALAETVRRHESLRTRFPSVDGEPAQVIDPPTPIHLSLVEVSADADPEAALRTLCADEALRPFDLAAGPLLRGTLARVGDDDHALLLTLHHAVSDGWSTGVLVRELSALYTAFAAGEASPLAPLPLQYADYAAWQRARLSGEVLEAQLAWWRETLRDAPPLLELPTDHPRPSMPTGEGGTVRFTLSAETADALRALARREGATLFMTLLAGWQLLLSRWSGQDDVCVGTPVAGRTRLETEGVIGLFVNTLVLRGDLSGAPSFRELLRRAREAALGAFQHQELPFERLVEELAPGRALGHAPLFQAMLIVQNNAREALRLGSLKAEVLEPAATAAKFDLTLAVMEADGRLEAELIYRADLFDAATAERMAEAFGALLAAAAAQPDRPAASVCFLGAADRRQLAAWNATERDYPAGLVHELFAVQAARTPDVAALVHRGETLSYATLEARANRLAHHLRARGAGVETRVGVCLERTPELIVALLAVIKAGGAYVPLDPAYPRERLGWMVEDADVRAVITTAALADRLPAGADAVCVDADRERIAARPADAPASIVHPQNLSHVIFTSGSTGRPKGVMIRHASTAVLLRWLRENVTDDERAAVLGSTSINFDVSVAEIFGTLCWGGTLVLVENALELPAVADRGIRYASMVPTAAAELLRAGGIPASVRTLNLGGEPLPNDLAQALYALGTVEKVGNLYGPTEDTTYSTYSLVPRGGAKVRVGRPVANTRAHVLDTGMRPVPIGVIGELYLAGDGLARGYAARPGLTAERFLPDPFGAPGSRMYRVMDRVRWTVDGELEYFGRTDFQVKVRGFRIELGEIETALRSHPAVADAVAVVREDAPGERRLAAYAVAAEDADVPSSTELRAWLAERLPEHVVPSAVVPLRELPRTPNGKIDRRALPAPDFAAEAEAYVAPRTPAEEIVAGIFAEVLGVEQVGAGDDFFARGGHSLLATRVVSRVREAFRAELPLRALFDAPTVRALAARIDAAREGASSEAPPLVPLPRDGALPLSFAQQRLWFIHQMDPHASAYLIPAALRLRGALDVDALERALTELVRRHETLRTTFRAEGGGPVAVVAAPGPFDLPRTDLRALPIDARAEEARRIAADEATRPFDLGAQPPVRARLVRVDEEEWQLSFTLHHVAGDGWSLGVLVREVSALYAAFARGEPSPLPELPIQYADYAAWQRAWLTGEVLDAQLAWWRDALAGAPPLLELPTDRPRPPVQGSAGGQVAFHLPAETVAALREVARRQGATLFMVLLAGWQALLARYAGADDVSVGTPVAGRTRLETEGLIGFFVNTLVLRTDLSGDPPFRELVARVRETTLNAYGHQDIPFERLVEELAPERSLRHTPLFQAMLVLQNNVHEALRLGPLDAEPVEAVSGAALFDLMLNLREDGDALAGTLDYRAELFDRGTVERMLDHLRALLRTVAADPGRRLSDVDLLDAAERARLAAWNRTDLPLPDERRVHRLIEVRARRTPDAAAVVFAGEALTYAELDARANRLARHLAALGAGPETRVGICLERSAEMVVALLAVLKAGAAYLPLDPSYPADRLAYMLGDSGAPLLVTQHALRTLLPASGVRPVFVDTDAAEIAALPADAPETAVDAENAAYVIYTSGSTGRPKGVVVTHTNAAAFFAGMDDRVGGSMPGTWLAVTRISFDIHVLELLWTLARGFRVVVQPEPDRAGAGEGIAEQIRRHGVTHLQCTPSLASMLLAESGTEALAGLERLFLGGEALPPELAARIGEVLPGGLVNLYGPTETTVWSATHAVRETDGPIPIGRPIANTRVHVVDAALRPQPGIVPGELCIAGAGVTRGYLGRPALTADRFVPDPFSSEPGARMYRTGDRVRVRECEGAKVRKWERAADSPEDASALAPSHSRTFALEYLGRIDQQVKIRGHRVEPGEIEAVLRLHPSVAAALVHAREDAPGDRRLVAYVVPARAETEEGADEAGELREGQVRQWETVWDDTYAGSRAAEEGDAAFDITGWNSSYTGEPIPAEEMREWVGATVARILALGPGRVLELGVGMGLLLLRVAPRARSYLGTDLSPRALEAVEARVRAAAGLPPVTLLRREAADFAGLAARAFDTAVLNSVCQYFPGPDYLAEVVDGAVERLEDGGAFFIGDVRHRGTLAAFRAAVEFASAPDGMPLAELMRRARRAADEEEELVVEPDFFHALARRNPRIGRVEARVKRGAHHNELTRHRYDVVLRVGPSAPRAAAPSLSWDADGVTMDVLAERIGAPDNGALAVLGVPDARVARELRLAELAADPDGPATVGEARRRLDAEPPAGIDPEALWALAEARGMAAELRPAGPGRFDVLFHPAGSEAFDFPSRAVPVRPLAAYANDPLRAAQARELAPRLRAWLRDRLPEHLVPAAVVLLDAFPLTPNGKLDRRALPAPAGADAPVAGHVAPRTATEEIVAGIMADVLRTERVGARDDFFALGGHSLLATQVAIRVRAAFGTELPLRALFQAPTAAGIAAWLDERRGGSSVPNAAPIARVAEPGARLPLSFAQQRLWLVHQMDVESRVYNQGLAFRLRGRLDAEALRRALQELIRRHAVFRTRFVDRDGVPGQVIDPPTDLPLPLVDLSGDADREAMLLDIVCEEARRLFDLASGTLLRVLLVRLADDDHALVGTMHHITNDGWSAGILFREVAELYHAFAEGRPSPLAEPALQYADYAAWQRAWLTPERERAQLDYWRRRLDGVPPLRLATDRTRAADGTDGGTQPFALSPEASDGVRRLSRALGATPFMTLLAAFQVLLHWQGGDDEIVVGTDIANRNLRAETEGMVGFFVNQLVLRVSLAGNPDFRALVGRVREETLAAYDHQDVPFDRVVEAFAPRRAAGETPFFRAKLVLQNAPAAHSATLPGLMLEQIPAERGAAQLDVLLALHDDGERMTGHWEYRTSLFSPELIARWGRRLAAVVEAAVADPSLGVDALRARLDAEEVRGGQDAQEAMKERRRARFARPAAAP